MVSSFHHHSSPLLCIASSVLLACYSDFHVAPMQGYTHAPMRYLLRKLNPEAILWTEMEKVEDILKLDQWGLDKRFGLLDNANNNNNNNEPAVIVQLGGNDVTNMKKCVDRICNNNYRIQAIDLNCGCPSIESGGASTFGASLMKDPELTRDLLGSIRDTVPEMVDVSLKCRIAVYESPDEYDNSIKLVTTTGKQQQQQQQQQQQYDYLHNYVSHAVEGGISQLVLHARPVILSGFSPTKNRSVPQLDYGIVDRIATDFASRAQGGGDRINVVLNGGIQSKETIQSIQEKYPNVKGVMAGRWILGRPLDLVHVQSSSTTTTTTQQHEEEETIHRALSDYFVFLQQTVSSRNPMYTLSELCMPLYLVLEQLRDDNVEEEDVSYYDVLLETIQFLSGNNSKLSSSSRPNWKKMSASLKGLVGTKVFNKWKRNRAEL